MTPKRTLVEVCGACIQIPGCYRSGGVASYISAGKPIPDFLLPGRFIQSLPDQIRSSLSALTSDQANDVAPWYLKQLI